LKEDDEKENVQDKEKEQVEEILKELEKGDEKEET